MLFCVFHFALSSQVCGVGILYHHQFIGDQEGTPRRATGYRYGETFQVYTLSTPTSGHAQTVLVNLFSNEVTEAEPLRTAPADISQFCRWPVPAGRRDPLLRPLKADTAGSAYSVVV